MARKIKVRRAPGINCPCGNPKYAECCEPYHIGKPVEDPETLLRTRYSAYAKGLSDYIIQTTDPDGSAWWHDEHAWRQSNKTFAEEGTFNGLRIIKEEIGDTEATIVFKALIKRGARDVSMTETSRFLRHGDRWFYHSGIVH